MEKLTKLGIVLKRPYLEDRRYTPTNAVQSLNPQYAGVKLVDLDTSHNPVFEERVIDEKKGEQKIRVVKTTKPYNPDFVTSAQTLVYMLPETVSEAIVTPLDGEDQTWAKFFSLNKLVIGAMIDKYGEKDIGDFQVIAGINFSPYANEDFLKTQTIKAAHFHSFLVSERLLDNVLFFSSRGQLREILRQSGTPDLDIHRDIRRFFPGPIDRMFSSIVLSFIRQKLLQQNDLQKTPDILRPNEESNNWPMNGIVFDLEGLGAIESPEFFKIMKTSYGAIDQCYRDFLMPVFTSNYEEVVSAAYPDPKGLNYNDLKTALTIFDEKIPKMSWLEFGKISKIRNLVSRIASRVSSDKPSAFTLGPAVAYTILYDPKTETGKFYIVLNPFGGGSVESIGIDKAPITTEEQEELSKKFYSKESVKAESELDSAIKARLGRSI